MADGADLLVGPAQLVVEANGLAGDGHINEKIPDMTIHATLVRTSLEAAVADCTVGAHGAAPRALTNRHLHDIAGASVLTTTWVVSPKTWQSDAVRQAIVTSGAPATTGSTSAAGASPGGVPVPTAVPA